MMRTPVALPDGFPIDRLRGAVLDWYAAQGRRLPFRGTTDPYLVLVSETILQQTQVSRGAPAWEAFVARFPTVEALAAASPADVLRAWRGLGYNRRALNLQRAARIVVAELDGRFPSDVAGLERLPGVGPYTARAVASIACGLPVGPVDTNVRRVLGRVIAGDPAAVPARDLQAVADRLVPPDRPDAWTHALMDLGSTLCRPRSPRCDACPVRTACRFVSDGRGTVEPVALAPAARTPGAVRARRAVRSPSAARETALPFERSSRWLRGRILDRLREVDGDGWATFAGPIGAHDQAAIGAALDALAREGLIELEPGDARSRARLPVG
jgi:A/G-specific adenine glycosylase